MTTANKITIFRILLIPVFVLLAVYYGESVSEKQPEPFLRYAAIAVFILASVTDGLDGYIARKYNQMSHLGTILDPIADKGLLNTAIITLSFCNWGIRFPSWFPVLVIARDLTIILGCLVVHYLHSKVTIRPSWIGKTTTVTQMLALVWVMLQIQWIDYRILVWISGIFTFISGAGYIYNGLHQLNEPSNVSHS